METFQHITIPMISFNHQKVLLCIKKCNVPIGNPNKGNPNDQQRYEMLAFLIIRETQT